jgi:hypothetical protein
MRAGIGRASSVSSRFGIPVYPHMLRPRDRDRPYLANNDGFQQLDCTALQSLFAELCAIVDGRKSTVPAGRGMGILRLGSDQVSAITRKSIGHRRYPIAVVVA